MKRSTPKDEASRTASLSRRLSGMYSKYREAQQLINELQLEIACRSSLERLSKIIVPREFEIIKSAPKEATAFAIASDWHVDEVVDSAAINGLNSFDFSVAERRSKQFFENTLKILNLCRSASDIKRLVFALLGDFISGWIHPDLIEASLLTPPEALLKVYEILLGGLKFLATEGNLEELLVVGCCGNHGRITEKKRTKGLVKKSYEWLLYEFLARSISSDEKLSKIIKFRIPKGYFNWLTCYNQQIRFHHGDNMKYVDGIGGVTVPLRKAIGQWNKARRADFDVMGHWHTRQSASQYVLNGSLIGYSEFAESHRCDFEKPSQCFFLVHPKHGRTAEFPIVLE